MGRVGSEKKLEQRLQRLEMRMEDTGHERVLVGRCESTGGILAARKMFHLYFRRIILVLCRINGR